MPRLNLPLLAAFLIVVSPAARAQCAGDADGDGDTDMADFSIVCSNQGTGGPCGDLNGDGAVDISDLSTVIGDLGCPNGRIACNGPSTGAIQFQVVSVPAPAIVADPQYKVFFGNCTHYTFDLQVVVNGPTDWFGSFADARLNPPGTLFFQHPSGDPTGGPPNPAVCPPCGALPFDSFWSTAAGALPGLAFITQLDQQLSAFWYDCPAAVLGPGVYTVARYTIVAPCRIFPKVVPAGSSSAPLIGSIRGTGVTVPLPIAACRTDCAPIAFDIVDCNLPGDVDRNCVVDLVDVSIVLSFFGQICP